ncbi:MAG: hypothetical protein AAF490_08905 [Chloroflexota bacterium]
MANNNGNGVVQEQTISELLNRVEWLEDERRKMSKRLTELDQRSTIQEREISSREKRITDLEKQIANASAQMLRIQQVDAELANFKDDLVKMIDQYDERRIQSENELDRLRRVEHEAQTREIADLRSQIGEILKLRTDLDLRRAEETRLATMVGTLQGNYNSLNGRLDDLQNYHTYLEEKEKYNNKAISEVQGTIHEQSKNIERMLVRIDTTNATLLRQETKITKMEDENRTVEESSRSWMEQIQIGEYERNRKLDQWRRDIDDQSKAYENFSKEWIKISDYYKQAQMAVQTLSQWQDQIDTLQREATEMLRVESRRMQKRWDDFVLDNQKRLKNYEIESEQLWATANRHEREMREQITHVEEAINKLDQEKDLLFRIQNAQSDALKLFPRLWADEVQKAIDNDPNRRRQPTLVQINEEDQLG